MSEAELAAGLWRDRDLMEQPIDAVVQMIDGLALVEPLQVANVAPMGLSAIALPDPELSSSAT